MSQGLECKPTARFDATTLDPGFPIQDLLSALAFHMGETAISLGRTDYNRHILVPEGAIPPGEALLFNPLSPKIKSIQLLNQTSTIVTLGSSRLGDYDYRFDVPLIINMVSWGPSVGLPAVAVAIDAKAQELADQGVGETIKGIPPESLVKFDPEENLPWQVIVGGTDPAERPVPVPSYATWELDDSDRVILTDTSAGGMNWTILDRLVRTSGGTHFLITADQIFGQTVLVSVARPRQISRIVDLGDAVILEMTTDDLERTRYDVKIEGGVVVLISIPRSLFAVNELAKENLRNNALGGNIKIYEMPVVELNDTNLPKGWCSTVQRAANATSISESPASGSTKTMPSAGFEDVARIGFSRPGIIPTGLVANYADGQGATHLKRFAPGGPSSEEISVIEETDGGRVTRVTLQGNTTIVNFIQDGKEYDLRFDDFPVFVHMESGDRSYVAINDSAQQTYDDGKIDRSWAPVRFLSSANNPGGWDIIGP